MELMCCVKFFWTDESLWKCLLKRRNMIFNNIFKKKFYDFQYSLLWLTPVSF